IDAGAITLNGTGTQGPGTGAWSGAGVSGNTFDPAVAGAGTHTLTFTWTDANGCMASDQVDVTVNPLPVLDLEPVADLCVDAAAVTLEATGAAGCRDGAGMDGDAVAPAEAGVGTRTLTHSHTDGHGCCHSRSDEVTADP